MPVKGDARLAATLRSAGRELGRMTEAADRSTQLVAKDAAGRAPKRTGRLSRSVTGQQQAARGQVVVTAPYGVFVEFGTRFTAAQPFLRPAVGTQTGPVLDVYTDEAQHILNQVKGA